ncbi:GTPase HflX [Marinigracilibium pacificum]
MLSTKPVKQTAVLVAVIDKRDNEEHAFEYLDELEFLASTLNIKTKYKFYQKLEKPDIRTFVGKGKLEEIQTAVKAEEIDIVIFDDDLTPSQLRNLERELQVKIYDRSLLILDIFLKRAQTAQAKTQVELARNEYLLPRLTRMWTHLERQRGGTGTRGGAGEKEIETDRRMIRNQINVLKKKLEKIEKQRETQRKRRENEVRVALVGYTNVGKSTIMRLLTKADVLAEDKLFATVDSTVRKIAIHNIPFLLSDTVGFIRKLPHNLIESFKSTLDEVKEADILMHVVDVSHPSFEDHMKVVDETLAELEAKDKQTLIVFNKIDQYRAHLEHWEDDNHRDGETRPVSLEYLKNSYMNKENTSAVFISAAKKENIEEMRDKLFELVKDRYLEIYPNFLIPDYYYGKYEED